MGSIPTSAHDEGLVVVSVCGILRDVTEAQRRVRTCQNAMAKLSWDASPWLRSQLDVIGAQLELNLALPVFLSEVLV